MASRGDHAAMRGPDGVNVMVSLSAALRRIHSPQKLACVQRAHARTFLP